RSLAHGDVARQLPAREAHAAGLAQRRRVDPGPGPRIDDGGDLLGPDPVRHAEDADLGDLRQLVDRGLDLLGADVLARALDHVLEPSVEEDVAVALDEAAVAGADP